MKPTPPWLELTNLIDGRHCTVDGERCLPVFEPATGHGYAHVPESTPADAEAAVRAARTAFPEWSRTSAAERARLLHRLADLIEARLELFALAESRNTGKTLKAARQIDLPRAIANLRFFAACAETYASEAHTTGPNTQHYTLRAPLGPVLCISPWNLPLYLLTWKLAPALAAGNTVIAKPSEVTPHTAWLLGVAAVEAGVPAGVLNIVHGSGAGVGAALVAHREVRAISFTGSTAVGRRIAEVAGPQFKKLSLELGGKNATIVFADADFEHAVSESVRAAFSNQGQICLCGSRILIERSLYGRFREAFVERVRALKVGDPLDPDTDLGAIVSKPHLEKILHYVELAHQEGGRLLLGGERVHPSGRCRDGWFMAPTVFEGLPPECRTNQEEIFGPVVTLIPFDDERQALWSANATPYGLAASVWTRDLDRAARMAQGIEAGMVWVNCWMVRDLRTPFGGVKQSGIGREGGFEAMRFFTEAKNVTLHWRGAPR